MSAITRDHSELMKELCLRISALEDALKVSERKRNKEVCVLENECIESAKEEERLRSLLLAAQKSSEVLSRKLEASQKEVHELKDHSALQKKEIVSLVNKNSDLTHLRELALTELNKAKLELKRLQERESASLLDWVWELLTPMGNLF